MVNVLLYMNVFGFNLKAGSKHACIVDAAISYGEPKMGQIYFILINQVIEIKGIDHHLYLPYAAPHEWCCD